MLRWVTSLFLAYAAAGQVASRVDIAFTGVIVVDVQAGTLVPNQTVVIAGGRIVAVGLASRTRLPRGALVVDGRG